MNELLTSKDKAFVSGGVAELLNGSGQIGKRYVPDATVANIYGSDDAPFVFDAEFQFEFVETPNETLTAQKCDAVISILPGQDINESDRVEFGSVMYKVVTVQIMNVFGVVSHKVVQVVRIY